MKIKCTSLCSVFIRQKTRMREMRDKNILVVKISVHVSLGMRGADTREDVSCFC